MMDSFMNWRMFANEDNLVGNDRLYNKYLDIYVLHPRTHIKDGRAVFTDYQVQVKTNHPEFAIKDSRVRRRYSEFVWLKNKLEMNDVMMITAPSLPGKRYFGRFKIPFLEKRQSGLQSFLNKVVEVNAFLSEPALHLFLQTELLVQQMDRLLQHNVHLSNIRDRVIKEEKMREDKEKLHVECLKQRYSKMCTFKPTGSADNITAVEQTCDVHNHGGRGWSNFIGDGCTWEVTTDSDVTDFYPGSHGYRLRSKTATACVLPGGQLRLADDSIDQNETWKLRPRLSSWHGQTTDIIDLFLDGYDVISSLSNNTNTSKECEECKECDDKSSMDSLEFQRKLSEYSFVELSDISHDEGKSSGFHHSYSESYDQG